MPFTPTHDATTSPASVSAGSWGGTDWFESQDSLTCSLKLASGATAPTSLQVRVLATNTTSGVPAAADTFEVARYAVTPATASTSVDFPVTLARGAFGDHRRYKIEAGPVGQAVTVSHILSRSALS